MRATRTAEISRYRTVEGTHPLHLAPLLAALRRLQPDTWARWDAAGEPVLFHRLQQVHSRAGREVGKVTVGVALDGRRGWARIAWTIAGASGQATLELMAQPCRIVGLRWFWRCPIAGHLCAALYLPAKADRFASRQAHRLHYRSQRETPAERAARRARKLRRRLGEVPPAPLGASLPVPPLRMRARTFQRLAQAIREAEARAELAT